MEIFKKYDFSGDTLDFLPHREPCLYISSEGFCSLNVMNTSLCFKNEFVRVSWGLHPQGLHHDFTLDQLGVRGFATSQDSGIGHLYVYSSCTLFCNSMSGTQIFVNKTTKNHRKYLLFHLKCSYFWTKAPKLVIWWLTKEKILLNILNISELIQQPEKGLVPVLIGKCP